MARQEIKTAISQAIETYQMQNLLPNFEFGEITVEHPGDPRNGDYSTNIALKIAPLAQKNPLEVAQILTQRLQEKILFAEIKIAPPGFINFYLRKAYLQEQILEILEDANYGEVNLGQGEKVQVEFISANPTGPLTLGNARGGFFGDVLANVLKKAGWRVEREFYINDAGEQIAKLGHSVLGDDETLYRGAYIEEIKKQIAAEGKDPKEIGREAADFIVAKMIKPVIENKMRIKFDNWFSEYNLRQEGKIEEVLNIFKEKKLAYEQDGALWFLSTKFGDDKDRVLVKTDGQPTYLAADAAYHLNKFRDRAFDKVIDIWGADHHGDVARVKAAVEVLGFKDELEVILYQFVHLMSEGKEVKMSKRSGTYVTVEELIDEVGADAARFFMLTHSVGSHLYFDLNLAKERSEKNPVFYIQYAYARTSNILKKALERGLQIEKLSEFVGLLSDEAELDLMKQLIKLPEIVEEVAKDYQVQKLPQYALDLVRAFHRFYEECRVLSADEKMSAARWGLVEAVRIVLKNTLDIMGILAPESM